MPVIAFVFFAAFLNFNLFNQSSCFQHKNFLHDWGSNLGERTQTWGEISLYLFILFRFSCFAFVELARAIILVRSNPNQSLGDSYNDNCLLLFECCFNVKARFFKLVESLQSWNMHFCFILLLADFWRSQRLTCWLTELNFLASHDITHMNVRCCYNAFPTK